MAARQAVQQAVKQVRPVLSTDSAEAKRRVLSLYRAWYRQIPYIGLLFPIGYVNLLPSGRINKLLILQLWSTISPNPRLNVAIS